MDDFGGAAVLVAGAAGFIGSSVTRALLARNARVVAVDNYIHGCQTHLDRVIGDIQLIRADVRSVSLISSLLRRSEVTYIVNCTGDTFVPDAYYAPQRFLDMNACATLALLTAARRHPITRFVQLSTTEVYGSTAHERLDEAALLNPQNTYAVTKLAADRLCYTTYLEHGTPVVIARLFNAYGPRETHPYLVPEIISQLVRNGPRVILGNLDAQRDLTYVDDTARALIGLLSPSVADGEVFNVGSDNSFGVRDVVALAANALGMRDVVIDCDEGRIRRYDIDRFRCNNHKLRAQTGWKPSVSIEEGLSRTVAWYQRRPQGWSWESQLERRDLATVHD